MDAEHALVKTFDPVLRDLLHWDLLARVEDPNGHHWQLAEHAARRLDELAAESLAPCAESMVFLGKRCGVCGLPRLTRRRGERYVCETCWTEAADQAHIAEGAPSEPKPSERHWITPLQRRTA